MWGWCRRRSPAGIGDGWATSASKVTLCCAFCWWRRPRSRSARTPTGGAGFSTWPCDERDGLPKVAMARKLAVRLYWMWRKEWDYEQMRKVRFARGRSRTSPGCVVDHRRNDWASHSPHGESEVVIMIAVVIEEMVGSD